jgi:hypothetical protein
MCQRPSRVPASASNRVCVCSSLLRSDRSPRVQPGRPETTMFRTASGIDRRAPFVLSAGRAAQLLSYDTEEPRTHYDIQQMAQQVRRIADRICDES